MKEEILKGILKDIETYGRNIYANMKEHGNRLNIKDIGSNNYELKWSLYPSKQYISNILLIAGYKNVGKDKFKKGEVTIKINYSDVKDKEELDSMSEILNLVERTRKENEDKSSDLSKAKYLYFKHGSDIDSIKQELGVQVDSYIDNNGNLTAKAMTKLRKVAVSLADSVDNNYIGGEEDSQQINMLIQAVDLVKLKDIFSKQTDRKLTASLRKLLKETMVNTFQTRFEKGIGKAFKENQANLINSYKDSELVGSNFNPLDYTDYFSLIEDLRNNVIAFDYVKGNGKHRRALGTRNKKIISQYILDKGDKTFSEIDNVEKAKVGLEKGYIQYFDLEVEDFRTFRIYPTGKGGNKSRLYSCIIEDNKGKVSYKRSSWIRIPVTSNDWIGLWDKCVNTNIDKSKYSKKEYEEMLDIIKEDLFTSISLPTGYAKSISVSNELVTKYKTHVQGIKEVKEDDKKFEEQVKKQKEEDSANSYKNIFKHIIYPELKRKENNLNKEFKGYKEFSMGLIKSVAKKLQDDVFKHKLEKQSTLERGIMFEVNKNEYYLSTELFANITNGIVYGTTIKRKVFKKWDTRKDKSLYGYDINSTLNDNLLNVGNFIRTKSLEFAKKQEITEDDLKIIKVKNYIDKCKNSDIRTLYNDKVLEILIKGGNVVKLSSDSLYLQPSIGSNSIGDKASLKIWGRIQGIPITNQLRDALRPYLTSKSDKLLKGNIGIKDKDLDNLRYVLNLIYKGIWGKVSK